MRRLTGIPVSDGSRVGRAVHHEAVAFAATQRRAIAPEEVADEVGRLQRAAAEAQQGLVDAQRALAVDPKVGAIFEVHQILLEAVQGELEESVRRGSSAEHAVETVMRRHFNRLAQVADPMFAERRQDVLDVEKRLLRALAGMPAAAAAPTGDGRSPVVVVAEDLTPSECAALAGRRVAGLVLEHGGPTSHTAIIAKALGFPCVVGVRGVVAAVAPGTEVWVDGTTGSVVVEPDAGVRAEAERRARQHDAREQTLLEESHLPAETLDGHAVTLLANIEFPLEVAAAAERGAQGIGLFRTEFLFDPSRPVPDEEEHLAAYRAALERMRPGRLTVRTFDFGADKATPGGSSSERNPALGVRSLRWCFAHPDVFRPQLRALLRVAREGDVRVMLPMVSSPEDVRHARALLAEAANGLARQGIPFEPVERVRVGAMIEIPAAAVSAELLAREVDFFSIGTNDLIQYTLAVDRTNEQVAPLFRPSHPAILRLIDETVRAARARGIPVTMCGEMGGEAAYSVLLLGLGLREVSLTPAVIPRVRRLVRGLTLERARGIAARSLKLATADDVDAYLHRALAAEVAAARAMSASA
ncbi:MAG: phosphoenolpyruvate--protein phosphotransferase [Planctomycetota bacterium]